MRTILATEVFTDIQQHIRVKARHGEAGWRHAHQDEDTLTGDFLGSLRSEWTTIRTSSGDDWRWRAQYSKFRGRGPGAPEKLIGADGIVQVQVQNQRLVEVSKGLLFQAKVAGKGQGQLAHQEMAMEEVAPGASAVFTYGPDIYTGRPAREQQEDIVAHKSQSKRLEDFLADDFLECRIGALGMFLDLDSATLILPSDKVAQISEARFHDIRHALTIDVRRAELQFDKRR